MSDMIDTLQQLQQLRQRYQRNINALNALTLSEEAFPGVSALQMANHAGYQRHIQRLIDWQKQEQALADIEVGNLQTQMQQQARREKIVAVVLEQQQEEYQREQGRLAQKNTDAL
ncbi:flagellar export protein FliJ, partial [Yersinia pestis]